MEGTKMSNIIVTTETVLIPTVETRVETKVVLKKGAALYELYDGIANAEGAGYILQEDAVLVFRATELKE